MAELSFFQIASLDEVLEKYGIRQAWANILATHISKEERLRYMLEDAFFNGHTILAANLIDGLSIGEIGVLYEYSVAGADAKSRRENGQFFTPDDIAQFMVSKCVEFPDGRWLDPCSGIGNLAWHLTDAQQDKENFLQTRLVLADIDDLALQIARVLFTTSFQETNPHLYFDLEKSFIRFDFLSVAEDADEGLFEGQDLSQIPTHDFIIMNPPYLALGSSDSRFETAKSADLYAYFMENAIKSSRGMVSITPQSYTNAGKFRELRHLLLKHRGDLSIYCFDNIPGNVFKGIKFGSTNSNRANSIRVAITVKKPVGESRKITGLTRWRTEERQKMLSHIDEFLIDAELTTEFFPKVNAVFSSLYEDSKTLPRLGEYLSNSPTEFPLYVPSAPRYFISALKKPVSRTSQRTIYFRTKAQMDKAYLLINCSLTYWWWRVRDGGMTLSLETLRSLPVPEFEVDSNLVCELEMSETKNRVIKRNAGADQENVKHPKELVQRLNKLVRPDYQRQLLVTHENSDMPQLDFLPTSKSG